MHPIERLRYVARAGDADPVMIAEEAAEALAALGHAPQALVPSCRRLIEAHPACGPLWWVAARMIVAEEPRSAAYAAIDLLEQDQSVEELAASFPSECSVAIPARRDLADAVDLRPDLSVTVVGSSYRLNHVFGRMTDLTDVIGIDLQDLEDGSESLALIDLVVLDAIAAGPNGLLVDLDQYRLLEHAELEGAESWVRVGVGRLLPAALFDALCSRVGLDRTDAAAGPPALEFEPDFRDLFAPSTRVRPNRSAQEVAFVAASRVRAVVGPHGRAVPALALRRAECVAVAELIGFAGVNS